MNLGDRMQELRIDRGLLQKDLADLLHVSIATISHYELNVHLPDAESLVKIAKCLNASTDYLLGITDEPTPIYPDKTVVRLPIKLPDEGKKELTEYIKYLVAKYKKANKT